MLKLDIKSTNGNEQIKKFLKEKGFTVSDQVMDNFSKIGLWKSWYKGYTPDFHSYKIYNGMKYVHQTKKTMQMAKRVSEDWANMLANEKTQINILQGQDKLDAWLRDNDFMGYLNTVVEKGMAMGTSALVLTLQDVQFVDGKLDDSNVHAKLGIFDAEQIYPLTYDEKEVTECAFVSSSYETGKNYLYVTVHHVIDGNYVIDAYKLEDGSTLIEKGVVSFKTNDTAPYFAIFKPNINNNQIEAPAGQSIFANGIDNLQGIDTIYDGFVNEFVLGRMRIFLDSDLTRTDDDGVTRPAVDFGEGIYYALPKAFSQEKNSITQFAPPIRSESFIEGIQENFNFLSTNCGLGTGFYVVKNVGTAMTATAIYAGNQDLYRSTKKHEKSLERVIRAILRAVNGSPYTNIEFDYTKLGIVFDDSIIENKSEEKKQDMSEINAGVLSKIEYRMKWYGESEEEAKASIATIKSETVEIIE